MVGFDVTMRKYRVSEPAPREIICLGDSGSVAMKALTRRSIAVVRMYVPAHISFELQLFKAASYNNLD